MFDHDALRVYRRRMSIAETGKPADFESAIAELEALVERLESGDLPLEDSLQAFERGVALTRTCQSALKEAEQKVEILLKRSGQVVSEEFLPDESAAL